MVVKRYTQDQLNFLQEGYKVMRIPELTRAFNLKFGLSKTERTIKSTLKNHNFLSGRAKGVDKGSYRAFTQEQAEFIRSGYLSMCLDDLTVAFNKQFGTSKTVKQIRAFTRNHSVKSGRTGRFEKGIESWNKGTKGVCKPNGGSFKKGDKPSNTKPLGHERICSKDGFILVKVAESNPYSGSKTRYKHKHIYIWEQANGPVPEGHVVKFIDGNKLNCDLDNLMLASKALNLCLNRHRYSESPNELQPTILATAKLEVTMFQKIKEAQ